MDKQSENHREEIIKSLRKELVSSEIRFQNIINQNSIPILIVSQDGIIRFANPSAEYIFHKSKEKLIGKQFGYPLLNDESTEIILTNKNSDQTIVEMRIVDTIWEEEKVFLISLRDVTDHRNIEEKLRVSEEKYRSLVDLSPFGIFVHAEGKCVFANPAGIALLGATSPEDIIGQNVMRFVHPEYRNLVSERINSLVQGEQKLAPIEEKFIKLDGTIIDVEVSATKFNYNNKISVQLVVIDITERKKIQDSIRNLNLDLESRVKERTKQLEIMNRELEAFSFSVSHDLKAPLRNIEGFANALFETIQHKLEPKELLYLERIKYAAANMDSLITDLLDLARINRVELDFQSINLYNVCNNIIADIKKVQSLENLELNIEPNINIYADSNLIKIAMTNLLDNAIKFTKHRQYATIQIGSFVKDQKNIVFIRDNGAGFNMKYADKLFEPFQRFHSNGDFEGYGIGLAIVSRIIDRHNGEIWAESEEGKGSTFYFVLD